MFFQRIHRPALLFSLALLPWAVTACKDKPSPAAQAALAGPPPDSFRVVFETSKGRIVIDVNRSWAPLGADQFYELVNDGYFDEDRFFRVVPGFVAQFGVNNDKKANDKWEKRTIMDDPVRQKNLRGTLAFAQDAKNSRTHQLFINLKDNTRLDTMNFAPIGHVVEGMNVADSIYSGYGSRPEYDLILLQGNPYLRRMFPKLDYIKTARIVPR